MKLYLLHGDMSGIHGYRENDYETDGYEAYVYGIFDTREKVEEAKERNLRMFYRPNPDEMWIEDIDKVFEDVINFLSHANVCRKEVMQLMSVQEAETK